jgi:hypothetical protein
MSCLLSLPQAMTRALCTTDDRDIVQISHLYDERAGIENEIKADKGGLLLPRRRKQH